MPEMRVTICCSLSNRWLQGYGESHGSRELYWVGGSGLPCPPSGEISSREHKVWQHWHGGSCTVQEATPKGSGQCWPCLFPCCRETPGLSGLAPGKESCAVSPGWHFQSLRPKGAGTSPSTAANVGNRKPGRGQLLPGLAFKTVILLGGMSREQKFGALSSLTLIRPGCAHPTEGTALLCLSFPSCTAGGSCLLNNILKLRKGKGLYHSGTFPTARASAGAV